MSKLALKGGKPVAKNVKVPQWPVYDEKDKKQFWKFWRVGSGAACTRVQYQKNLSRLCRVPGCKIRHHGSQWNRCLRACPQDFRNRRRV